MGLDEGREGEEEVWWAGQLRPENIGMMVKGDKELVKDKDERKDNIWLENGDRGQEKDDKVLVMDDKVHVEDDEV